MRGAEPATGPDLPGRLDQVCAALPDIDRVRFEQELDQALDITGLTLGPGAARPCSRGPVVGDGCAPAADRGLHVQWFHCSTRAQHRGAACVSPPCVPHLSRPRGACAGTVPQRSGIIIGAGCWCVLDVCQHLQREYRRLAAETVACPLAQSVERIQVRKILGAILLVL